MSKLTFKLTVQNDAGDITSYDLGAEALARLAGSLPDNAENSELFHHLAQSPSSDVRTEIAYPPDVASRAKRLLTYNGHLPTGGNASTILSFWAYKPMFDEIEALARESHCTFTLYVDDMSITGVFANRKCQQEARRIIARYGLRAHKAKAFAPGQPRVLTGVAITRRGRELPHRRAKGIAQLDIEVSSASTSNEKLNLLPTLIGKLSEATIIDPAWSGPKAAAIQKRRKLKAGALR